MSYKTHKTTVYLTDKEFKKLESLRKKSGLTKTALVEKMIINERIRAKPSEELLKIYRELNHIGSNIHQIAIIANMEKHVSAEKINEARDLVDNLWKVVREYA